MTSNESASDQGGLFGDLAGCRALVTGAASGIGRATALELARGGARVIVHCRSSVDAAEEVSRQCRQLGPPSHVLRADLGNEAQIPPFVERAFDIAGGLEIWINNAGADLLTGPDAKLDYPRKLE